MEKYINHTGIVLLYLFALTAPISISAMSIAIALFMFLFLINLSISMKNKQNLPIKKDFALFIAIYLYKGFTLLINNAIYNIIALKEVFDKSLYLTVGSLKISKKHIEIISHILFFTFSFLILYALGQKYLHFPVIYKSLLANDRFIGYFGSLLHTAGFLSILALISFSLGVFYKRVYLLYFPILFFGLVFNGTRSYFLGIIPMIIILSAFKGRLWILGSITSIGVLTSIVLYTTPSVLHKFQNMFNTEFSSNKARLNFWQEAFNQFLQHPLFGVGYEQLSKYLQIVKDKGLVDNTSHAHSLYLHELAEGGIIGFLLIVGTLLYFVRKYYLNFKQSQNDLLQQALSIGIVVSIINVMIAGLFEYNFGTFVVWVILTFFMGLLEGYKNLYKDSL